MLSVATLIAVRTGTAWLVLANFTSTGRNAARSKISGHCSFFAIHVRQRTGIAQYNAAVCVPLNAKIRLGVTGTLV